MMSLGFGEKIAIEFVKTRKFFEKIGFELIGTKDINGERIFLVKKKKKSSRLRLRLKSNQKRH